MKPQHLLISAAVVAAPSPALVSAFLASTSRSQRSCCSILSSTHHPPSSSSIDSQDHLSEMEDLIADLVEVNGGGWSHGHGGVQVQPPGGRHSLLSSPGRITPSALTIDEASSAHGMPWTTTYGHTKETNNPLLYMPFWNWQFDFMKSSLTNLHPMECWISSNNGSSMDASYNENKDKRARVVSQCYASDEYRKIRMTYYDGGDAVQVFNSVWYPDATYNLPILGIDLLSFDRKRYIVIVDFQPLHEDEDDHATTYEHILKPIRDKYGTLNGRMSSKFYDTKHFFSNEMLFARFDDGKIVEEDLFPAFQSYVTTHLDLLRRTAPAANKEDVLHVFDRQRAYDTYLADRDPAVGLFAAMFGKQWAEDFIYDFLFSLSERTDDDDDGLRT
mmetsp:Transcript_4621/g.8614  ORF Transcript_4621/g.8614 Transcript_4621/m.8614 type:complete len:388 (+) Transcript_4621:210-1373(+)